MAKYNGKRVVVIGGTSGIGLATARILAGEGACLLVTGTSPKDLATAREALGRDAAVLESDIGSMKAVSELKEQVAQHLGSVDLLFINAGINPSGPFDKTDEATFDKGFTVNAKGPYFTAQAIAPLLVEGGSIVFTTSVANVKGLPASSVYAATKAALRSMTRTLARELTDRKIRVNAVSPGPIDTPILAKGLREDAAQKMRSQMEQSNPMKRFGSSDEVARAVVFLGFEATYTTGAELPVDGGASQL